MFHLCCCMHVCKREEEEYMLTTNGKLLSSSLHSFKNIAAEIKVPSHQKVVAE